MEITPGIRRCSFGFGEITLTPEQVAELNTDEALVALGTRVDDIQDECEASSSRYQCKCGLAMLMQAIREKRRALGNKEII